MNKLINRKNLKQNFQDKNKKNITHIQSVDLLKLAYIDAHCNQEIIFQEIKPRSLQ